MALEQALSWLDRGLYRYIFRRSVKQAVMDAEQMLYKAKSNGVVNSGPADTLATVQRLETAVKCVTAVATELSQSAALIQLLMQLLLVTTVRRILQCSRQLEEAMSQPAPGDPQQPHTPIVPRQAPQLHSPPSSSTAASTSEFTGMQFAIPVRVVPWKELLLYKPLGHGAYGCVFSGWLKGSTLVAVKCLEVMPNSSDLLQDQRQLQEEQEQQLLTLMEKEAMVMLANQHPNIVRCLAVCYERPAIILELCTGGSLYNQVRRHHHLLQIKQQSLLAAKQPLPKIFTPLRVLRLLHQVAIAMDFLHAAQEEAVTHSMCAAAAAPAAAAAAAAEDPVCRRPSQARQALPPALHCDLRAPNLLLAGSRPEDWCIKVADFGLAQWVGPDGETAATDRVTNHLWLAPEVLQSVDAASTWKASGGAGSSGKTGDTSSKYVVSKAADVYSYGCIIWEVLTGRMPFETDSIHPHHLQALAGSYGNPVAARGPMKWPDEQQLLPGFNTPELQQLRPIFEACINPDASNRPSFDQIQTRLADLVRSAAEGVAAVRVAARSGGAAAAAVMGPAASAASLGPAPADFTNAAPFGAMEPSAAAPGTPGGQQQQQAITPPLLFMPSLTEMADAQLASTAVPAAAEPAGPSVAGLQQQQQRAPKTATPPATPNHLAPPAAQVVLAGRDSSAAFSRFGALQQQQPQQQLISSFVSPFMVSSRLAQVGESKQ